MSKDMIILRDGRLALRKGIMPNALKEMEEGIEGIAEDQETILTKIDSIESWVREVEGRCNGKHHGALKKDTMDPHPEEVWAHERWCRGLLLSGAPETRYRDLGQGLMKDTFPDRLEAYHMAVHEHPTKVTQALIGTSSDIVPTDIVGEVLGIRSEIPAVRTVSRIVDLSSDTMKVPTVGTSFSAFLIAEGGAFTDSGGTFTSVSVDSLKFGTLQTIALETVEDAAFPIVSEWFSRVIGSVDELETQQALEGADTGNEFEGLIGATGVVEVTLGDLDEFVEMAVGSIPETENNNRECVWFMNKEAMQQIGQIKEATELKPMIGTDGLLASLLGYRVIATGQIANNRGAGTDETTIYFGYFRRGMVLGDRGVPHLDTSISATDAIWSTGLVGVRFYRRVGIIVAQPNWFAKGTDLVV